MANAPMTTDFEPWFLALTEGASIQRRALIRPWFLSFHEHHGPAESEVVSTAWALQRLEASELAVAMTVADIHRTTTWQPIVELNTVHDAVEITVEGHTRAPATTGDPWDE